MHHVSLSKAVPTQHLLDKNGFEGAQCPGISSLCSQMCEINYLCILLCFLSNGSSIDVFIFDFLWL